MLQILIIVIFVYLLKLICSSAIIYYEKKIDDLQELYQIYIYKSANVRKQIKISYYANIRTTIQQSVFLNGLKYRLIDHIISNMTLTNINEIDRVLDTLNYIDIFDDRFIVAYQQPDKIDITLY